MGKAGALTRHRRDDVLRAIVSDFVRQGEPVGSKTLVDHYDLGVSPATIRNDMAVLEEEGYLYQPHTSAGRVPTQKGYRAFVNRIATLQPLSQQEKHAIETFLEGAYDIDDVLERTVRLLSQLTHQLAIVQYPVSCKRHVRHIELVRLAEKKLLVVVITDSGDVEQRAIDVQEDVSDQDITGLRIVLNVIDTRLRSDDIDQLLTQLGQHLKPQYRELAVSIINLIQAMLQDTYEHRTVVAGAANLVRSRMDFQGSLVPILDALEENMTVLRLFSQHVPSRAHNPVDVSVSIGQENEHNALVETAVISDTYHTDDQVKAHLGVVGPLRMNYPATMAAVSAVASYLSRYLRR